jgi:sulfur carrier protein
MTVIVVNGSERSVRDGSTVTDLVELMELPTARGVAVARNGDVVSRSRWDTTEIEPGDRIEVLHAVQGG